MTSLKSRGYHEALYEGLDMDAKKADKISTILAGLGVIFLLLPLFNVFPENQDGLLLVGVIFLIGALFFKQLAR